MKVALVHDWLIHMRGGEKVLEALAEIYPEAAIYTLFANRRRLSPSLQRMKIKTSVLQYFPGIEKYYRWLLPFLPFFIRSLRIREADLVISTSHCVAKGIPIPAGAQHICYCFTPMRYLWGFGEVYFEKFPRWLLSIFGPIFEWLRRWDADASRGVDHFFSISEAVRDRILASYGREAWVIYPPVDAEAFKPDSLPPKAGRDYYFIVSALTPYKKVDLAIEAFNHWDRELLIAGDGPMRRRYLKAAKSGNIHFLGKVSDQELKRLYVQARALLFPQEEEFGIVALEAQACGTPVIAFGRGGALETVREGVFFYEQNPEALRRAVLEFESRRFDPIRLREQALRFDKPSFKTKIRQAIENVTR